MNATAILFIAFGFSTIAASLPVQAASRLPVIGERAGDVFRSVRPPAPGTVRRITSPAGTGAKSVVPRRPGARVFAPDLSPSTWFWAAVDPAMAAADPARLGTVLGALSPELARLGAQVARRGTLNRVLEDHGEALFLAAKQEDLSLPLLLAVIAVESGGRERAVSPAGAQGLMQLMPATAARFGVSDPLDPAQNIAGGARYLSFLLRKFDEDALLALAAYNAGENAVLRFNGAPPYPETMNYVPKAVAAFDAARAVCEVEIAAARGPCLLDETVTRRPPAAAPEAAPEADAAAPAPAAPAVPVGGPEILDAPAPGEAGDPLAELPVGADRAAPEAQDAQDAPRL